jgi:hypothetical protein
MRPQVADTDLVFVNKYGTVLVIPDISQRTEELEAEADYRANAHVRFVTGMKFAIYLALPFWAGILYWWLK